MKIRGISAARNSFEDLVRDNDLTLVAEHKYIHEDSDESYRVYIEDMAPGLRLRRLANVLRNKPFAEGQYYGQGKSVDDAIKNYLQLLRQHRRLFTKEGVDPPNRISLPDNLVVSDWKTLREQCMAAIRKDDLEQRAARRASSVAAVSPQG